MRTILVRQSFTLPGKDDMYSVVVVVYCMQERLAGAAGRDCPPPPSWHYNCFDTQHTCSQLRYMYSMCTHVQSTCTCVLVYVTVYMYDKGDHSVQRLNF